MKNPTTKNKWLMSLNIAGEFHYVLFDGESVYDYNFPEEKIVSILSPCGVRLMQEELAATCKDKMQDLKVVCSALDGTWMCEQKDKPFSLSVASEAYWSL